MLVTNHINNSCNNRSTVGIDEGSRDGAIISELRYKDSSCTARTAAVIAVITDLRPISSEVAATVVTTIKEE